MKAKPYKTTARNQYSSQISSLKAELILIRRINEDLQQQLYNCKEKLKNEEVENFINCEIIKTLKNIIKTKSI